MLGEGLPRACQRTSRSHTSLPSQRSAKFPLLAQSRLHDPSMAEDLSRRHDMSDEWHALVQPLLSPRRISCIPSALSAPRSSLCHRLLKRRCFREKRPTLVAAVSWVQGCRLRFSQFFPCKTECRSTTEYLLNLSFSRSRSRRDLTTLIVLRVCVLLKLVETQKVGIHGQHFLHQMGGGFDLFFTF